MGVSVNVDYLSITDLQQVQGHTALVALRLPPTGVSGSGLVNVPGPGCHVGLKI